jgi:hypothetical protein
MGVPTVYAFLLSCFVLAEKPNTVVLFIVVDSTGQALYSIDEIFR